VGCFKTSGMTDINQRLMQAVIDEEPHALLSRVLKGKNFRKLPLTGFMLWRAPLMCSLLRRAVVIHQIESSIG
jgi:hypothetical protein